MTNGRRSREQILCVSVGAWVSSLLVHGLNHSYHVLHNTNDLALALSEIVQGLKKLVRTERKCLIRLGGIKWDTLLFLRPKHRTTFQSKILHFCDMLIASMMRYHRPSTYQRIKPVKPPFVVL